MNHNVIDPGSLEIVVPKGNESIRWLEHGYPSALARWHYHPEIEIHLIRTSMGTMMAGDGMVPFGPGQVSLLGSNVPHNWISEMGPNEKTSIPNRDVACQVLPNRIQALAQIFPEAMQIMTLLRRGDQAIVLNGQSARRVASILTAMGAHHDLDRLIDLLEIFRIFVQAPRGEWTTVVTPGYQPEASAGMAKRVNQALAYIKAHIGDRVTLEEVAAQVAMDPSAFSRFFKKAAGINFSEMVCRLRTARASLLLVTTDLTIAQIRTMSGFRNAANFNRRFKMETGTTPRAYRQAHYR
ncbi:MULTISPECIES: helix-turn-helix domain-containing protein [Bifidobacterium]|uniref:AraC family transcriptional regulator n=3 Tax=Bifidobacterium asteroides TaxID=1684 RepID=A0A318MF43_9BIFI|nr:AraC family transcriptional regulator [Bifidobacterium asteroides]MCP8614579.1 AraC family transcriptional regulator [Bifidobacterium asteroides]MCT6836087.1 AraC family transcriptional regulator [Bifidobacteriales bacterium]PXY86787.1 AraC family transcriptional regulator [Bifidobacterium asteroides]